MTVIALFPFFLFEHLPLVFFLIFSHGDICMITWGLVVLVGGFILCVCKFMHIAGLLNLCSAICIHVFALLVLVLFCGTLFEFSFTTVLATQFYGFSNSVSSLAELFFVIHHIFELNLLLFFLHFTGDRNCYSRF